MIKVLVFGATGRMGLEVIKAISDSKTFKLAAAISSPSSKYLTHDSGALSCDRVNEVLISGSLTDVSGDVDVAIELLRQGRITVTFHHHLLVTQLFGHILRRRTRNLKKRHFTCAKQLATLEIQPTRTLATSQ